MKYAIFFAGSGQKVCDQKLVYADWAERLRSAGYQTFVLDGVGVSGTSKWDAFKNKVGLKAITGSGWAAIVGKAMDWLIEKSRGGSPQHVVLVGMSRGGVEAVVCANCVKNEFPQARLFVFAIDPVQGAHVLNDGSFDMRDNRPGARGTRDTLKARYRLDDQAPKSIPDTVDLYLSVLAQFRGSTRGLKWGFTPQSPSLQGSMVTNGRPYKVYELPGDHSSAVHSGYTSKGGDHAHKTSRQARSLVTRDMFFFHLLDTGFARIEQVHDFTVMDAYCLIAIEDLGNVQFDGKNSGFSFLRASHTGAGRAFLGTADSRMLKGRGHLIASSQVAASQKLDPAMHGYYVNERHFKILQQVAPRLEIEMRKGPGSTLDSRYPNIRRWLVINNREFR